MAMKRSRAAVLSRGASEKTSRVSVATGPAGKRPGKAVVPSGSSVASVPTGSSASAVESSVEVSKNGVASGVVRGGPAASATGPSVVRGVEANDAMIPTSGSASETRSPSAVGLSEVPSGAAVQPVLLAAEDVAGCVAQLRTQAKLRGFQLGGLTRRLWSLLSHPTMLSARQGTRGGPIGLGESWSSTPESIV